MKRVKYYVPTILKSFEGVVLGSTAPLTLPEGVAYLLPVYTDKSALRRDYGDAVEVLEFWRREPDE